MTEDRRRVTALAANPRGELAARIVKLEEERKILRELVAAVSFHPNCQAAEDARAKLREFHGA